MLNAGSPYDQIARQYMADALSGNTTAGYGPGAGINVTRSQVKCLLARHPRPDPKHLQEAFDEAPAPQFGHQRPQ